MDGARRRIGLLIAAVLGAGAACTTSTVEVRPEARALAPAVTTIVALPTSVDWGGPGDQRRLQRRTGDSLLELTGGRAVITEELTGDDDASVVETLRALGEDPNGAITFRVRVGLGKRIVPNAMPISSFSATRRLVVDYTALIEVRRVGSNAVIGTVETIASGSANEPEVGPDGKRRGPLAAIDDALDEAVRNFAPRLATVRRRTLVVEVPRASATSVGRRLEALAELYPELSVEQMQRLGQARERFLVVAPGPLAALGLAADDLLGVPGGDTAASHAALMRAYARGKKPLLAVERHGQRYILAAAR
jgi:hypothetical protein